MSKIPAEISNKSPKTIGDRIEVLDFSSASDLEGCEYIYDPIDFRHGAVVFGEERALYQSQIAVWKQNLILHCPATGMKLRINSNHVKIK